MWLAAITTPPVRGMCCEVDEPGAGAEPADGVEEDGAEPDPEPAPLARHRVASRPRRFCPGRSVGRVSRVIGARSTGLAPAPAVDLSDLRSKAVSATETEPRMTVDTAADPRSAPRSPRPGRSGTRESSAWAGGDPLRQAEPNLVERHGVVRHLPRAQPMIGLAEHAPVAVVPQPNGQPGDPPPRLKEPVHTGRGPGSRSQQPSRHATARRNARRLPVTSAARTTAGGASIRPGGCPPDRDSAALVTVDTIATRTDAADGTADSWSQRGLALIACTKPPRCARVGTMEVWTW